MVTLSHEALLTVIVLIAGLIGWMSRMAWLLSRYVTKGEGRFAVLEGRERVHRATLVKHEKRLDGHDEQIKRLEAAG